MPVRSITSPEERRPWLDPRLLPRLAGRRVLLVDDVVSTGASARAGRTLLAAAGVVPVAVVVAMAQGDRWQDDWPAPIPLRAAFASPVFARSGDGWAPRPGSAPHDLCPLMPKDFTA